MDTSPPACLHWKCNVRNSEQKAEMVLLKGQNKVISLLLFASHAEYLPTYSDLWGVYQWVCVGVQLCSESACKRRKVCTCRVRVAHDCQWPVFSVSAQMASRLWSYRHVLQQLGLTVFADCLSYARLKAAVSCLTFLCLAFSSFFNCVCVF